MAAWMAVVVSGSEIASLTPARMLSSISSGSSAEATMAMPIEGYRRLIAPT